MSGRRFRLSQTPFVPPPQPAVVVPTPPPVESPPPPTPAQRADIPPKNRLIDWICSRQRYSSDRQYIAASVSHASKFLPISCPPSVLAAIGCQSATPMIRSGGPDGANLKFARWIAGTTDIFAFPAPTDPKWWQAMASGHRAVYPGGGSVAAPWTEFCMNYAELIKTELLAAHVDYHNCTVIAEGPMCGPVLAGLDAIIQADSNFPLIEVWTFGQPALAIHSHHVNRLGAAPVLAVEASEDILSFLPRPYLWARSSPGSLVQYHWGLPRGWERLSFREEFGLANVPVGWWTGQGFPTMPRTVGRFFLTDDPIRGRREPGALMVPNDRWMLAPAGNFADRVNEHYTRYYLRDVTHTNANNWGTFEEFDFLNSLDPAWLAG